MKISKKIIPLFKVRMPESAIKKAVQTLRSGYISEGQQSHQFEAAFQRFIGNPYIALVNSGTSAVTLALRLAGVSPGDEVISTPMTCVATNEPIALAGAQIVWADIDRHTGNIDPSVIEKKITPRTKAVMVVHWGGNPVNLSAISQIAKKNKIKVIEDAAHALGATYNRRLIGNHSDFVCFSFQAIKHLTTADGGALAVKTQKDYDRACLLRWFGCSRNHSQSAIKWQGDIYEVGYKMHMNDLNASLGLAQLKTVNRIIQKQRANAYYLKNSLRSIKIVELPQETADTQSSHWLFTIKLTNKKIRDQFSEELQKRNINNGIVHNRNDHYSVFKKFSHEPLPGVTDFCQRMLNIPCGWWLSKKDLDYIAYSIKEISEKFSAK